MRKQSFITVRWWWILVCLLLFPLEMYLLDFIEEGAAITLIEPPPPSSTSSSPLREPTNKLDNTHTYSSSCFQELQKLDNQEVQWEFEDPKAKCSKLKWKHGIIDPSNSNSSATCSIPPFDPRTFVQVFEGRTLVFVGDSLSSMYCMNLQDILAGAGLNANELPRDAYHRTDPFRRRISFGCQEFQNGILICCGWIAFSNSKMERKLSNQDLFSDENNNGILMNVMEPSDLVIWNAGVHHTRSFQGTTNDLIPMLQNIFSSYSKQKKSKKHSLPSLWWKESYAQHFETGHWESRKQRECHDISMLPMENETGIYNQVTEPLVQQFHIPVMRVYKASVPLYMAHNKSRDCTHYCTGDRGPMDHDNALLLALIQNAIREKVLPPITTTRTLDSKYDLQKRWLLLMSHPTMSLMSKLTVCAHPNHSERKHYWDTKKDGRMPQAMRNCLPTDDDYTFFSAEGYF
ncbi:unnamed protein product [Cylindrotheca closterium]|uniref:Uncharacterized protein n=1 Tax=Cylindrotheca closterium TaxID=2856 RepID=A0AAD2PVU9_9STRA|nr:unnamed protein product [Cylindrotheca closterium]